jgi:hypothetical protein
MNNFISEFKYANTFLRENFRRFKNVFFFFFILGILELIIPPQISNREEGKLIIFRILEVLCLFINSAYLLKILKRDSVPGDFLYILIPYVLYSIYYTVISLVGLLALFIPGVLFFYVPIVAAFHNGTGIFKTAFRLFKKEKLSVTILSLSALILEVLPSSFDYFFGNGLLKMIIGSIYSVVDAYLIIVFSIIAVSLYYKNIEDLN